MTETTYMVPDVPKRVIIGVHEGYCNLNCPMCFVHGNDDIAAIKKLRGKMSFSQLCTILDSIAGSRTVITPITWYEPFIMRDINKYFSAIKERGFALSLNTNGLLLDADKAKFCVDIGVNTIFISIDATTPAVLMKMRGVDTLDKIHKAVFYMLDARGTLDYPRIGVAFVETPDNTHEKDDFISYWLQHVDSVHVTQLYNPDRTVLIENLPQKRIPCGALYDTLVINHKGNVPICCLDAYNETNMGNVFESGVKGVWLSDKMQMARYYHETDQFDKVPFCANCKLWADYIVTEKLTDTLLIRSTPISIYYNRLDRMYTWKVGEKAFPL